MQTIEHLWTPDAEQRIRKDLEAPANVWLLVYNLQLPFFRQVFDEPPHRHRIQILADRTQRTLLGILKKASPEIEIRIWSRAWVMHAKAIILPERGITYLGSPNLTPYSYRRALNLTLRIESYEFTDRLHQEIVKRWRLSKPLE